jgi:hypothetical protein
MSMIGGSNTLTPALAQGACSWHLFAEKTFAALYNF